MRNLLIPLLLLAACTAAPSLSTTEAAVYTFDDSDPTDAAQLAAVRDTGHADYNADSSHHRKCLHPTTMHATSTGHLRGPRSDSYRCPGHAVQQFIDAQASGSTNTVQWQLIRDELLRGQSWDATDAEVRRHMRILAEEADVLAGLARPEYEGIPDVGVVVVIAPNPAGTLEAVLGLAGRVQPPATEETPDPEAWTGALVDMSIVP